MNHEERLARFATLFMFHSSRLHVSTMAYNNNGKPNGLPRISEFKLKEQMCDVGRRIWIKGFCAGNEGNHSYRIGPDRFLCTPTGISKGNLKPDDLCVV